MHTFEKFYIDGQWQAPNGTGTIEVINPTTEQPCGTVPSGDASDVDTAVAAAKAAFKSWSQTPSAERAGFFIQPTVFADVTNDMTIAQGEIFSPVLTIIPCDSEEEAIAIANDSPFGLSGAVWGNDVEQAKSVAKKIRTGQITINAGEFNVAAPFGGYKQSGNGRELGIHGLHEFIEIKSLQL